MGIKVVVVVANGECHRQCTVRHHARMGLIIILVSHLMYTFSLSL